jgi:ADP-ribosylglycohydrolase
LKAVNLGDDTDTVGAVAGGLAGLAYGYENIPKDWIEVIALKDWIEKLCGDFAKLMEERGIITLH